jgi:hypothetical protein
VAIGLQAWLAAAARLAGGQLAAAGLVMVGLVPLAALLADLAGRFDAGLSVWQDLVLMFADGQIGFALVLIGCVLAGAGVAIVAVAGNRPTPSERGFRGSTPREPEPEPEPGEPEGAISVRRQPRDSEPEVEPTEPPAEAQPAEPERDPRLWSKPRAAISPPPGSRIATP